MVWNSGQFQKGHKRNLEKVWTKESRDKLSKTNKGKHHSPNSEFKKDKLPIRNFSEKRNDFLRVINLGNNGCKGYKHSEENIRKIKEAIAKQILPLENTSIELKIQKFLTLLNIEYVAHKYIEEIEHKYCCDICIPSIKTIIECDGDYWHNYPIGKELDNLRNIELKEAGYRVIRLWEHDINSMDLNKFQEIIK